SRLWLGASAGRSALADHSPAGRATAAVGYPLSIGPSPDLAPAACRPSLHDSPATGSASPVTPCGGSREYSSVEPSGHPSGSLCRTAAAACHLVLDDLLPDPTPVVQSQWQPRDSR